MLVRNVGHLMTNPSIILSNGNEVPEGIMDAFITVAAAIHDLKNKTNSRGHLFSAKDAVLRIQTNTLIRTNLKKV